MKPVLSTDPPFPVESSLIPQNQKNLKKYGKNGKKSCDPDYVRMMMPNTAKQSQT